MSMPDSVTTHPDYPIPETYAAWVLGDPGQLTHEVKPMKVPGPAEVLVHIDAISICATDFEIIDHGPPALIEGGLPFNKGFTPGHEYMGTVVALGPGVDEFAIGDRVTVEIHAGIDIFWMKQNATEAAVAVREHFWGVGTPHGHDTAEPHGAAADVPFDIDNDS